MQFRSAPVIFDLDGTLVDTAGEIARRARAHASRSSALPRLPEAEVRALIGRGVRLARRARAASASRRARSTSMPAVERFEAHYAQTVGTDGALYPGRRARACERLRRRGLPARRRHQQAARLHACACSSGSRSRTASPRSSPATTACRRSPPPTCCSPRASSIASRAGATLMLGDSANDVLAARAAGCPVWCVPYGYNEGRPVETLGADRIVADVAEAAARVLGVNPVDSPA